MPKYPESQTLFARLMTEGGFQFADGTYDRKRFCETIGISPRMLDRYLIGTSSVSLKRLREICCSLNLTSFNIMN